METLTDKGKAIIASVAVVVVALIDLVMYFAHN